MKRAQRLRGRNDFERVRRSGRSWSNRLLVLAAFRNELDITRIGFAAGKRIGSAVARNRAKRLMREAAAAAYPHIAPGWDLVLIARGGIVGLRMEQVAEALEELVRQAGLTV